MDDAWSAQTDITTNLIGKKDAFDMTQTFSLLQVVGMNIEKSKVKSGKGSTNF